MDEHTNEPTLPTAGAARRGFLGLMTLALGGLPILGGLVTTMRAGLAPAKTDKPPRIPLCKLSEVPAEGIKEVAVSYQMRQGAVMESVAKVVFVTRDPADSKQILALSGECTHLSCPVQQRPLEVSGSGTMAPLTCPCHGGMFSRTGEPIAGPPKRPLRRYTLDTLPTDPDGMIYLLDA